MNFISDLQRAVSTDGLVTIVAPRFQPTGKPHEALAEFSVNIGDFKSSFTCIAISTIDVARSCLELRITSKPELDQAFLHKAYWDRETSDEQFIAEFSEGLIASLVIDPYRVRTACYTVVIANSVTGGAGDEGFSAIMYKEIAPTDLPEL
jgi:hypothetical protein